ncbi:MAG: hypothetical protein JXR96_22840 [Deltaproteobacteria bacterium]|nr:hypothetical protein [Deltaproteobacteria bacterium]
MRAAVTLIAGLGLVLGCVGHGTHRLGESCTARSDCVEGLTCVDQVCAVDEGIDRSCEEIEAIYLEAILDDTATSCAVSKDCFVPGGLCNASDERAEEPPFLNRSLESGLETLEDEWEADGCEQGVQCDGGTFGYAWCIQGSCGAGGDCNQTLNALCLKASGSGCDLFDGSSFACEGQLLGQLACDPEAADSGEVWACLDEAELSCASEEDFVSSALAACGQVLGLTEP